MRTTDLVEVFILGKREREKKNSLWLLLTELINLHTAFEVSNDFADWNTFKSTGKATNDQQPGLN